MCGTCGHPTIPSERARATSVGKTPSFNFCQVDVYAQAFASMVRYCAPAGAYTRVASRSRHRCQSGC